MKRSTLTLSIVGILFIVALIALPFFTAAAPPVQGPGGDAFQDAWNRLMRGTIFRDANGNPVTTKSDDATAQAKSAIATAMAEAGTPQSPQDCPDGKRCLMLSVSPEGRNVCLHKEVEYVIRVRSRPCDMTPARAQATGKDSPVGTTKVSISGVKPSANNLLTDDFGILHWKVKYDEPGPQTMWIEADAAPCDMSYLDYHTVIVRPCKAKVKVKWQATGNSSAPGYDPGHSETLDIDGKFEADENNELHGTGMARWAFSSVQPTAGPWRVFPGSGSETWEVEFNGTLTGDQYLLGIQPQRVNGPDRWWDPANGTSPTSTNFSGGDLGALFLWMGVADPPYYRTSAFSVGGQEKHVDLQGKFFFITDWYQSHIDSGEASVSVQPDEDEEGKPIS